MDRTTSAKKASSFNRNRSISWGFIPQRIYQCAHKCQEKLNVVVLVTYDVEPLSIPDVLADRPVIVFGKYRGQSRGKIVLNGISGNGSYREAIDVRAVKPLPDNSALRYLWARHRVALLSDYSKLRPNDERQKEVTDLGLAYNLLTAYTSFVAVDTQVRNQNGEVTIVKQPLPLPQGASDYAVGGMKLSRAYAPLMAMRSAPSELGDKTLREEIRPKEESKRKVTLGEVTVGEGLSPEAVFTIIQKKIIELEKSFLASEPGKKLILGLTIGQEGKVKKVSILSSSTKNDRCQQFIIEQVKKWRFPATQNGQEAKVTITLVFG